MYKVLKAVVHALLVGSLQSYRWFVNPNPRFCQVLLDPGGSCCYSRFPCSKSRNFGDWVEIPDSCSTQEHGSENIQVAQSVPECGVSGFGWVLCQVGKGSHV